MPASKFIVEICQPDNVSACRHTGKRISTRSKLYSDLKDCTRSGDCEQSCRYVIREHNPEFRIVKQNENVIADHSDKIACCKAIYFESETDFEGDEIMCEVYLVWQAAHDLIHEND